MNELSSPTIINPFLKALLKNILIGIYKNSNPEKNEENTSFLASQKIETINIATPDVTKTLSSSVGFWDAQKSEFMRISDIIPSQTPQIQQPLSTQIQESPQPQIPKKSFIQQPRHHISGTPLPSQHYNLEKLNLLINDKHVYSIECPGPGKPLKIKSLGLTRETKIILSEKEIRAVIEKFSTETKIPSINGIFKAAINNILVTAILSDKVGSRFLITKQERNLQTNS